MDIEVKTTRGCGGILRPLFKPREMKVIDKRKENYSIGDWFLDENNEPLQLVQVGYGRLAIIHILAGSRCKEPIDVGNITRVTQDELNQMHDQRLTRVNVEIHITSNAD